MSELKTQFIDDTYVEYYNTGKHELAQIYLKSEADKVIAEKDKEIAELKAKLENVQASAYAESVDAGMRERRLRRALYKACANWAYWVDHALTTKFLCNNSSITKLERDRWYNMEHKCLKKMEEYK